MNDTHVDYVIRIAEQAEERNRSQLRRQAENNVAEFRAMLAATLDSETAKNLDEQLNVRVSEYHTTPYRAMFTYGSMHYTVYPVDASVAARDMGGTGLAFFDSDTVWRAVSYEPLSGQYGRHAFYFETAEELCIALS